jgi:hypothetical protein
MCFSSLIIWVIGFGIFEYFEIDNFNRGIFLLGFPTLSVGVMQYVTIFGYLIRKVKYLDFIENWLNQD